MSLLKYLNLLWYFYFILYDLCNISGLGMTDHHWTVDSLRPYVLGTIEGEHLILPSLFF